MKKCCLLLCLLPIGLWAQNQPPQIDQLLASYNPANQRLTVDFDLSDAEGDQVEVSLLVSTDGGQHFDQDVSTATGAIGFPVSAQAGNLIFWDAPVPLDPDSIRVKVVVDDQQPVDIAELVAQVDSARLRADLTYIAQVRHRTAGLTHLDAVKDTIETLFGEFDLSTRRQTKQLFGYLLENVLGRKSGISAPDQYYILDAHFDGVANSPGADDNGSGTVGVLEAARILSAYEFEKSIEFVGFDQEELGLLGSISYVQDGGLQTGETLEGVLNLEMIGYYDNAANTQIFPAGFDLLFPAAYNTVAADSFRGNFITNVANAASSPLMQSFEQAANTYVPGLKVISIAAPGNAELAPDLRRSDHTPFWEAGYQALMLTDASEFRNFNYHSPQDTVASLNYTFLTQVVQASIATLAELAGLKHATSAIVSVSSIPTSIQRLTDCNKPVFYHQAGQMVIDFSGMDCSWKRGNLQLLNLQGQTLWETELQTGDQRVQLATGQWARGIYLVQLETDGMLQTMKVNVY